MGIELNRKDANVILEVSSRLAIEPKDLVHRMIQYCLASAEGDEFRKQLLEEVEDIQWIRSQLPEID